MRDKMVCLFPALLLLTVPGSSAIRGPGAVQGWERGSLTVGCRYDPGYETYRKWWCRGTAWLSCKILVQTTGSEQEVKRGRVSISDNQRNRTFTVTMEELRLDDTDTYLCGIERTGVDLGDQVTVTVDPEVPVEVTADPGALRPSTAPDVKTTDNQEKTTTTMTKMATAEIEGQTRTV